jgi:hypothetical protein
MFQAKCASKNTTQVSPGKQHIPDLEISKLETRQVNPVKMGTLRDMFWATPYS